MAVYLIQGEEPVMPQAGQDPALHQQHALLGLGLVAGFARTRRQDGHPVVLGPLLVAGVDVRDRSGRHGSPRCAGCRGR